MKILLPYMARWKAVNWTRYHSLLTCVAEMGHEVYVLQPPMLESQETNYQEIEVRLPENLHLLDIDVPMWFWKRKLPLEKLIKKGIYSLWALRTAKRIVKEKRIDVVLTYNIPQLFFLLLPGPKKVFDYADDYLAMFRYELGNLSNPAFMALARKVLEMMIKKSDIVFAVSNVLANKFGDKVIVLPNGVDIRKVEYAKGNPLDLQLKRPIVGFIGSFEYFIDFDLILQVAERLQDVTFLLVGKGRLWEGVGQKIESLGLTNVVLIGGVPHQDVFRYIDQMDICLNIFKKMSVSHGACPIKLFEYMSMRKPVISTRLDELKYIDKDFLPYGDEVGEIVAAIRYLLANEEAKERLVDAGYAETMENYTWPAIARKFIGHIQSSFL